MNWLGRVLLLLPAMVATHALAADIGTILLAVGEVRVERDGGSLAVSTGTVIVTGDVIVTGPAGSTQIRLADGTLLAVARDSAMRIDAADQSGCANAASLDLRHGLVRVVGRRGESSCRAMTVLTLDARLVSRGERFAVAVQRNQGATGAASRGTHATVSGGMMELANGAGTMTLGDGEFVHVASAATTPRTLLAPPMELADRALADRSRGASEIARAAIDSDTDPVSGPGLRATRAAWIVSDLLPPRAAADNAYLARAEVQASGGTLVRETSALATSGTVSYLYSAGTLPIDTRGNVGTVTGGSIGINFGLRLVNVALNWQVGGHTYNFGNPFGTDMTLALSTSTGATGFTGTFTNAGRCSVCNTGGITAGSIDTVYVSGQIASDTGQGVALAVVTYDAGAAEGTFQTQFYTLNTATLSKGAVIAASVGGGVNIAIGLNGLAVNVGSDGRLVSFDASVNVGSPIKGSRGTSTDTIVGTSLAAGNQTWGKWTGSGMSLTMNDYNTYTTATLNYITGDPIGTLPATGTGVIYNPVGGVVNGGSNGTFNGGTISVDFVGRKLTLNSLSATNVGAGLTYLMNGNSSISSSSGRFGANFTTVTCSGATCGTGTPSGSFGGRFFGTNAEGLGIAFTAGFGTGNGVTGVQGFQKCSGC